MGGRPLVKWGILPVQRKHVQKASSSLARFSSTYRQSPLHVSEEVINAVRTRQPVVALETTIYTHGFPYPENIVLSSVLESLVREHGGVPATIGILNGVAKVGMQPEEITELLERAGDSNTVKVSRRDLGIICGTKRYNGGTTIGGTLVLAHLAGIKVFATGGLGGVHRDKPGETSMDISADLTELGRTPVALISSGCKSFLDIGRTLEYLETQGVGVGTFADGRKSPVKFPAFWTRESEYLSPNTITDEKEAAAIIHAQLNFPVSSGLLFANPISPEYSLPESLIDQITVQAVNEARDKRITGNANTPFILSRIRDLSDGATVAANRALIEANVVRGTKVAVELSRLESLRVASNSQSDQTRSNSHGEINPESAPGLDVLVAGSMAMDINCNYDPLTGKLDAPKSPIHETSNPASITQSLGGVGHNVATASHYIGARTVLCSTVGVDIAGNAALDVLKSKGMSTDGIIQSSHNTSTAQYIAFNDTEKNLVMAMADMKIMEMQQQDLESIWARLLTHRRPQWLVLDANWDPQTLIQWIRAAKQVDSKIAFEPVSAEKCLRIFTASEKIISERASCEQTEDQQLRGHFRTLVDLVTPNEMELRAMCKNVQTNANGNPAVSTLHAIGLRQHLEKLHVPSMMDVATCAMEILSQIPCVLAKLGPRGVLQVELLTQDDPRLRDKSSRKYIVQIEDPKGEENSATMSKTAPSDHFNGAIYLRHHPVKSVPIDEIRSVNGVGDTFLGALVGALSVRGQTRYEDAIEIAQLASVKTLKSVEAVSPEIEAVMDRR